ncbi:MAG: bifunctional nuclease domain-containing protein [Acidimicrobiales bacterium]
MTESMTQPVDPAASVAPEETAPPEEGDANGSAPETAPEMEPETVETTEPVATSGPSVGEDESVADGGAEPEPEPAAGALASADFRTALVATVTVDLPNQHATVVLRENESPRRHLSFAIGIPDAVALSHALRRITTPRPLTHELMTEVLEGAEVDLVAVRVVGRQGAVYFAELDVRSRAGRGVHACRPSDGLTLALLQKVQAPILVDRRLFEEAGDVAPA